MHEERIEIHGVSANLYAKRLAFSEGEHDDWPDELIDDSISFIQDNVLEVA